MTPHPTIAEKCPICHHNSLRMQYIEQYRTKHYCYLCGYREYRDFDGTVVFHAMIGELLEKEVGINLTTV